MPGLVSSLIVIIGRQMHGVENRHTDKRKGLGLAHINNNPAEFMICHKLVQQYQFDCQSVHRYLWQVAQK